MNMSYSLFGRRDRFIKYIPNLVKFLTFSKRQIIYQNLTFFSSMSQEIGFRLSDYDCIGFDLDNTLCTYKLRTFYDLVYSATAKSLIEKKGYDEEIQNNWEEFEDFICRGLIGDLKRGNFLKVNEDGYIFRATHGTRKLKDEEIVQIYGSERIWSPVTNFISTCIEDKSIIRVFKDFFDMAGSLLMARIVDILDKKAGKQLESYDVWNDVFETLMESFRIPAYAENSGGYFPVLKQDVSPYIYKCKDSLKSWLKKLKKQNKIVYLITSSHLDYASLLCDYCFGLDWKEYFDVCVTNSRKPGFFLETREKRPFLALDGFVEINPVPDEELQCNICYSQGNWQSLNILFQKLSGKPTPKVLYFGDNLVSDVLCVPFYSNWHSVAVIEEMASEAILEKPLEPQQKKTKLSSEKSLLLKSALWGSFFYDHCNETSSKNVNLSNTLWGWVMRTKSHQVIPSLDVISDLPLDYEFCSFTDEAFTSGFYPNDMIFPMDK